MTEFVGEAEQSDGVLYIGWLVDGKGDPSGIGEVVVWLSAAGGDELIADGTWEREIGDAVTVQVTEFTRAEMKLDAGVVRRGLNPRPCRYGRSDLLCGVRLGIAHLGLRKVMDAVA